MYIPSNDVQVDGHETQRVKGKRMILLEGEIEQE